MNKALSATQNLRLARSVREQGFNSVIDSQLELKEFVDQQLTAKISPKHIQIAAKAKFPKLHVPSMPSFYAYAKRFAANQPKNQITVDPGTEKYFDMIGRFDVLKEMYTVAQAMEQDVDDAVNRGSRTETVRRLRSSYADYLLKVASQEIQLGIRQKVIDNFKANDPDNAVTTPEIVVTKEEVDMLVNDLDRLFRNRERLAKWSKTKMLTPEQSLAVGARRISDIESDQQG